MAHRSKASFGSYGSMAPRSPGSTATDLLADVSMTQARQTGQDVLSAVTAGPEPFGPQLSTAKARLHGQGADVSWTRHTSTRAYYVTIPVVPHKAVAEVSK